MSRAKALRNAEAPAPARSEADTDYPTSEAETEERFRLYRLCPCARCEGTGKEWPLGTTRCPDCRGEGKVKQEVATAATPADVGLAIVQLGQEGEWEGCQFGLLDSQGEVGLKWLVRPWTASPTARNLSDAGRVLRQAQTKGEK